MPIVTLAVQSAHGVMGLFDLKRRQGDAGFELYVSGAMPKISVRADSENELSRIYDEARAAGIGAYLVLDAGRTELAPSTPTVCAFGPAYRDDWPPRLRQLRLL
jgi:peptidyl-tRNA hydrolase, PTH2 family